MKKNKRNIFQKFIFETNLFNPIIKVGILCIIPTILLFIIRNKINNPTFDIASTIFSWYIWLSYFALLFLITENQHKIEYHKTLNYIIKNPDKIHLHKPFNKKDYIFFKDEKYTGIILLSLKDMRWCYNDREFNPLFKKVCSAARIQKRKNIQTKHKQFKTFSTEEKIFL